MDSLIQGWYNIEWHKVFETAIILGLASLIGYAAFRYRLRQYKKQEATLHKLAVLRTEGVKIRNKARGVNQTSEEFKKWKTETEKWKAKLYTTADDFSLGIGEQLRTLDLWKPGGYTGGESKQQRDIIAYMTETIERTDLILDKWFRPTHAP